MLHSSYDNIISDTRLRVLLSGKFKCLILLKFTDDIFAVWVLYWRRGEQDYLLGGDDD